MSAKLSARRFTALNSDEQPSADPRPRDLDKLIAVPGDVLDTLSDVFAGTGLLDDQARIAQVLEARREIEASWGRAARSFVEVGRSLLRLDETLTVAEKAALKFGCERLFPFTDPIASQLRSVARAVDAGVLAIETCPASYSVAYQLTLLKPAQMAEAKRRGLITPAVTRAAVIAFRKEQEQTNSRIDETALLTERRRVDVRIDRLKEELRTLEARRDKIDRLLAAEPETGAAE